MSLLHPPALGGPPDPDSPPPDPRRDELLTLVGELTDTQRRANALAAERYRALDTLRQRWEETYGASMSADPSGIRFRSMRAQIAVVLLMPERSVETQLATARALIHALPATFDRLAEGRISDRHARILSDSISGLPHEDRVLLEERLLPAAETLAPAKFERKVRLAVATLHPEQLEEKARAAREMREFTLEAAADGMAWLHHYLPAEDAVAIWNRADATARHLAGSDEPRSVSQLRSDVVRDILLDDGVLLPPEQGEQGLRAPSKQNRGIAPTVQVTVPVLTLNGVDDTPGILKGYGPIDPETARRLAGTSTGLQRILTHPVTGVVLQYGRGRREVPVELRRYVVDRDEICRFPGCNRPAATCDIDHTRPWCENGTTDHDNLAAVCRNHHRVKHDGGWKLEQDDAHPGVLKWTTPIGLEFTTEPAAPPATRIQGGRLGSVLVQTEWAQADPEDQPPF
ncbi:HNH endonuclease signature motif containing protein [Naasia sp. SYSU D00057]|uniref:HNH endonuclease signature motif containing protein n=1 Tax=Naasia sp. SYSU D00057 TaxID=2817380 RepID=UPI001B30496A|nr:HNH endonuclease signature motif containing protein [Naasia sp. SYSU D00057]